MWMAANRRDQCDLVGDRLCVGQACLKLDLGDVEAESLHPADDVEASPLRAATRGLVVLEPTVALAFTDIERTPVLSKQNVHVENAHGRRDLAHGCSIANIDRARASFVSSARVSDGVDFRLREPAA